MNLQTESLSVGSTGDLVVIQRNSTSGSGRRNRVLLDLIRELRHRRFKVRMFSDRNQLDAFVGRDHVTHRIRCLVAAGGDGTLSSLVNRHPGRAIATLPMGTENLVARHLNMPCNGAVVADVIKDGYVRVFDTAQFGSSCFLLMASAGIDAQVVHRLNAERLGNIRRWTYLRPILQTFLSYGFPKINVTDVNTGKTVCGTHVIVSNFREYGFHLKLNSDADPTDGQLDVCVFQKSSPVRLAIYAIRSIFRTQNGPHLVRFRSQHVSLSATTDSGIVRSGQSEIPLQADGDMGGQLPVDIRIKESSMQLLAHRV
ncbi:MAG: hypothetical protein MK102_02050 [Fuerstiella sp.]|nr:hypothetical protein [Fuerstiella sp.]